LVKKTVESSSLYKSSRQGSNIYFAPLKSIINDAFLLKSKNPESFHFLNPTNDLVKDHIPIFKKYPSNILNILSYFLYYQCYNLGKFNKKAYLKISAIFFLFNCCQFFQFLVILSNRHSVLLSFL
jgi:hypothetical protein